MPAGAMLYTQTLA